jgi:integrase
MIDEKALNKAYRALEKTDKKYCMILYLYVRYPFLPISKMVKMTKENVLRNIMLQRKNYNIPIPTDIKKKLDRYITSVKGKYLFSEDGEKPIKPYKVYRKLKEIEKKYGIDNLSIKEIRTQYTMDKSISDFQTVFNARSKDKIIELF